MRLLDYLRISLGEGHEHPWEEFVKYVEKFLGDKYRREFERSVLLSEVSNNLLGIDANWKNKKIPNVCAIKNFKIKPNQYPEVKFLKDAIKVVKKEKKIQLKRKLQKEKESHRFVDGVEKITQHMHAQKIKKNGKIIGVLIVEEEDIRKQFVRHIKNLYQIKIKIKTYLIFFSVITRWYVSDGHAEKRR